MAREIPLNKEVFNKRPYQKTIDTSFKELGVKTIQEQLDAQPTVQEFFDMYTELFYQINERGPDNSHEYLVKTSGEYISFEEKDELVQALQLEIANLRKELLQTQQDLADSLGDLAEASQPLPEVEEVEVEIPSPVVDIVDTPEPTQDDPPPPEPKKASAADQAQFNKGYKFQIIPLDALINNMKLYSGNQYKNLLPEKPGNELRDLGQIGSKDNITEATYNDYFKNYFKTRSSGKETKNMIAVLGVTCNFMRDNFKKNKEFGTGFMKGSDTSTYGSIK